MTNETITKVRTKWIRLNRYTFQQMLKCDLLDLARMLRETYGYSRSQAERELHEFQLTLRPLLNHSINGRGSLILGERKFLYS